MNRKCLLAVIPCLLFVTPVAFADRDLNRDEILQLFQQLTAQPQKTWLPAGTIKATHDEYRAPKTTDPNEIKDRITQELQQYLANPDKIELTRDLRKMKLDALPFNVRYELSNEAAMRSDVVVRFDGERFYWEINVQSRTDSLKPGKDLEANFMTDEFNLTWNARRIFAWDGEKYTTYAPGANHATVDAADNLPRGVNGPLTAGIIPWGYGSYTYENLAAAESAAVEKIVDGCTQIHLTIYDSDGSESLFILDAEKDYAVLSCSMTDAAGSLSSKQYSDYQLVSDNWVPATILIERYEAGSDRLLTRDLWDITSIDGDAPEADSFVVSCADDTLTEYFSYMVDGPQVYRHSALIDTDLLLSERLAFLAAEDLQPQNCATAASKYVASKLGIAVTDDQLAQLVNDPNEDTSLYQIKQFMQSLGLYCRAVKADIKTLTRLNACEVILHIPGKEHFVAFERIDNDYVWVVDLAANKFYYRTDINFFGMDWTDGTALLISDRPITGQFTEIGDNKITAITGAQEEYYKCSKVLQTPYDINCDYVNGLCGGLYYLFRLRKGCDTSPNGSCTTTLMIRYQTCPCIDNPPNGCKGNGEWTYYYMRACA
jgi:hypothetical protein